MLSAAQRYDATALRAFLADHFTCPITLDVPNDPVFAEDGIVYERAAIEGWVAITTPHVRSPLTTRAMGTKLVPAVQVRKIVRTVDELERVAQDTSCVTRVLNAFRGVWAGGDRGIDNKRRPAALRVPPTSKDLIAASVSFF